ncbi:MAG: aminotransferase class V-fold PLP-dependent enzyme [Flavobacteriales bacterium]|nr:aminotransferase class V-fold PLP-dependent enzyme [Flavobacteriales bacterium]
MKVLEAACEVLEPDADQRARVRDQVIRYSEKFLEEIDTKKAYVTDPDKGAGLLDSPLQEDGCDISEALELIGKHVDTPGLNPASGGHLGYVPGGGIYFSALGDYLADVSNRYAGIFFASPGAVRMENQLIEWMAGMVGYPSDCAGNLASGGSIANLIALVTARDAKQIEASNITKSVIYLSPQVHHCLFKAIRIAGLRECIVRHIDLDPNHRINTGHLEGLIRQDLADGLHPWLVIASAGTTDTGAVDPLDSIGDLANRYDLWYHVDAAYGGFFALCEEGKRKLKGMEQSDSIVIDPHKGMFLPYGLGAVLIKDREKMFASHHYQANYMQDANRNAEIASPADLSPELTKHFRGLRMWLPLKLHGAKPFRAAAEEKLLLANYFYDGLKEISGFEVGAPPDLSVVLFRYVPANGDVNAFNQRIVDKVIEDGRFFFSSTTVNGKFMLRVCILAFRTHKQMIDLALSILKDTVNALESDHAIV